MKFHELSTEDQALLNTDFGDLEKVAAAELAEADELYAFGMEKAAAAADEADEEEEEENKKKLPKHLEKEAFAKGAFIAQGMIEKLAALGEERHGDDLHYFYPAIQEKLAGDKWNKVKDFLAAAKNKTVEHAGKAKDKVVEYHAGANRGLKAGLTGKNEHGAKIGLKDSLQGGGLGAAKYLPHAAAAGGGALGVHKLLKGKKKEEEKK